MERVPIVLVSGGSSLFWTSNICSLFCCNFFCCIIMHVHYSLNVCIYLWTFMLKTEKAVLGCGAFLHYWIYAWWSDDWLSHLILWSVISWSLVVISWSLVCHACYVWPLSSGSVRSCDSVRLSLESTNLFYCKHYRPAISEVTARIHVSYLSSRFSNVIWAIDSISSIGHQWLLSNYLSIAQNNYSYVLPFSFEITYFNIESCNLFHNFNLYSIDDRSNLYAYTSPVATRGVLNSLYKL